MNILEKLGFSRWSLPHISNEDIECNCPHIFDEELNTVATLGEIDYSRGAVDFILENTARTKRNGRLIASAPELLEALIEMVQEGILYYDSLPNSHRKTVGEYYATAISVIEKATGLDYQTIKGKMYE